LHRFRGIARFLHLALFSPKFGVFPLHEIARIGVSRNINLKLISRIKLYLPSIPTYVISHGSWASQTDRQTDARTDDKL